MNFDWTSPNTWTLKPDECTKFADAVIRYCDNCAEEYPDAVRNLANLRTRAKQLRTAMNMSQAEFDHFLEQVPVENKSEGTGFAMLAAYARALRGAMKFPDKTA